MNNNTERLQTLEFAVAEQRRIIDELQKENDRMKSIKAAIYRWATKHQGGHF